MSNFTYELPTLMLTNVHFFFGNISQIISIHFSINRDGEILFGCELNFTTGGHRNWKHEKNFIKDAKFFENPLHS